MNSEAIEKNEAEQKISVPTLPEQDKFFDTEYLKTDLKGRSVRGGAVTMGAQVGKFTLQMTSIIVLARLLTPKDFGLVAMVTAITSFVALFKEMGLSMATVQRAEINHGQISTLFWFNVAVGVLMALFVSGIAPAIAWFYSEPRLLWVTLASSIAFIFGGLTVQHQALLRRQMRFGALAGIDIIAMAVGVSTAIFSAWYGAGYWALVLLPIMVAITIAFGVWVKCGWRPGSPIRGSGVCSMLVFGGNITGFNVVNYFARAFDKILIGRCWGVQQLGLYHRAYRLLLFPLQQINVPISAVAIPALSRLQDESERFRRYYLRAVSLIGFVTMPAVMFMIMMSKPIIRLVLGEQWIDASKIFAILGVSALIQPILNTFGWLFVSTGHANRMLRWGLVACPAIVASFFVGLPYGPVGVATAYTVCVWLLAFPGLWYACKATPVDLRAVVGSLWRTAFATIVVGVALVLFKMAQPALAADVLGLVVGFIGTVIIFISVLCALARSLAPIREVVSLAALARSKQSKKKKETNDKENKQ
ncbi:MAG: lipopolysaccharide biosynthesis protein [Desulfobacteraceae bacterium]|nr:lipopolysaccharide biosynthesis protein [Desulfobacteraceae bacterium]